MLILLTFVMSIPAGAVDEIEIVRYLDKPHAGLDKTSRQQTALAELTAV